MTPPLFALLLAQTVPSQVPPTPAPPPAVAGNDDTIIVTGVRIQDTARRLKECIARKCPPAEDIDATLAHAENLFIAGDYQDARIAVSASVRRNGRHAKTLPVEVAGLQRASARIAAHLGEGDFYRLSLLDMVDALRAGLPADDPRILVARVELADGFAAFGRYRLAERDYLRVAREAREHGQKRVEGYALLRDAALKANIAAVDPGTYRRAAEKALDLLAASTDPAHAPFVRAARVIRARLAAKLGDRGAVDAVIAEYAGTPTERPLLLSGDPVKLVEQQVRVPTSGSITALAATASFENQWIDVGFWIGSDGRTTDAEVLRTSAGYDGAWDAPVLASVRSRRYAPLRLEAGDPGLLRVERYTFTSRWTNVTGSRLRVREPVPRIEMLDLSQDADPAATPTPAAAAGGTE